MTDQTRWGIDLVQVRNKAIKYQKDLVSRAMEHVVKMDESGISSSQVISFDYHVQSPNIVYSLLYRDSDGDIQLASWSFLWAEDKAKAFKKAFLDWMTTTESSVHSQLP